MATRLIQIVPFPPVGASATVVLPHNVNINGVAKRPDYVAADTPGFTIVVTATTVAVTNNNSSPSSVNVWLELKHSIPRQLGALLNLSPQPFVASPGGAGGGGGGIDLLDEGVAVPGNPHTAVNFVGGVVDVTDDGGGQASVTILPDVTQNVGSDINIENDVRFNVNHGGASGIAAAVSTPNGTHVISSQSFPGRSFYSGPEVDAEFFGARSGPQDLAVGAGGNFNDMLVVRSQCFGVPPIGGSTITGIDANTTGSNPPMDPFPWITIFNDGTGSLTIAHESGLSFADNRFHLVGGADLVIPPNGGVVIARRSAPTNRWFVVGVNM